MKILLLLFIASFIAACAPPINEVDITSSLNEAEFAAYNVDGTGRIDGQAFLRQRGGGVVTCAGSEVFLLPWGEFTKRVVEVLQSHSKPAGVTQLATKYPKAARKTICDAQGNFSFKGLRPGDWYVFTAVSWVAGRYSTEQGSILGSVVNVSASEPVRPILNDSNRLW